MKNLFYILLLSIFVLNCKVSKTTTTTSNERLEAIKLNDTVKITNEELEYEIIIIEPGFNNWLQGTAQPRGFYSQGYLEARNKIMVIEWNQRVLTPQRFNPSLYEMQINYEQNIDYGYEVNYMLYNYFIYFQLTYNQRLGPFVPRI
ncbi:DUF6146 family protein [uncultured Algibacter sp.]|uniref:DUF6146 family protein n=1 Tax=uncultured Algibacter sp. TaxID=298659 RepID=UPI00261C30EC|nr:DUF6146 family protein [uncultured Algibacter sp.]